MNKKTIIGLAVIAVLGVALFFAFAKHGGGSGELMSMAQRGATENEMLAAVDKSSMGRPSADQIIEMKNAGVPSSVIVALLHKNPPANNVAKK